MSIAGQYMLYRASTRTIEQQKELLSEVPSNKDKR